MSKTVLLQVVHLSQIDTEGFCLMPQHILIFLYYGLAGLKNDIGENIDLVEKSQKLSQGPCDQMFSAYSIFSNFFHDRVTPWGN